jgi:hypothetical protein
MKSPRIATLDAILKMAKADESQDMTPLPYIVPPSVFAELCRQDADVATNGRYMASELLPAGEIGQVDSGFKFIRSWRSVNLEYLISPPFYSVVNQSKPLHQPMSQVANAVRFTISH